MGMKWIYPAYELDHDGCSSTPWLLVLPTVKLARLRGAPDELVEEVSNTKVRLMAVDRREYDSNSGCHKLRVLGLEPIIVTRRYDLYAAEWLESYSWRRRRFGSAEEAFDAALKAYAAEHELRPPLGCLAWKVAKGYHAAALVRPAAPDELAAAVVDFTLRHLLDLAPYLDEG
jgi:hypothetical protein